MNTATLLRQAMHQLEAAHAEAVMEYGAMSEHASMLADAIWFMRDWMQRYFEHDKPSSDIKE